MGRRIATTLRRAAVHAGPTVLGIIVLDFLFLQLMPGDAADVMATEAGSATEESMAALRHQFGLDQPVLTPLLSFLSHLAHLDLGFSPRFNTSVMDLILQRLPGTVVLFSVKLGWLPNDGSETIGANFPGLAFVSDRLVHLILPALALASFFVAVYARLVRTSMLEVQRQDFMRTAHAKGLNPFLIQLRHALRNALIPVTTVAGMHLGNLLGGAVVVETLFGWPGMGRLALESVLARDFSVLLGVLLLSSLLVIIANVVIDLLHAWLDPRIGAA